MAQCAYIGESFEYLGLKGYWCSYGTGKIDHSEITVIIQGNEKHQGWSLDYFSLSDPVFSS